MPKFFKIAIVALMLGMMFIMTACGGGGGPESNLLIQMFSPDPEDGADLLIGQNPILLVARISDDNQVVPTFDVTLNGNLVIDDGAMFDQGNQDENTWQCTNDYRITLVEGTNNVQIAVSAGTDFVTQEYTLTARAPIDGFVLTWDKDDSDLDLHLVYVPNDHPTSSSAHFYFGTLDSTMNQFNLDPLKFRDEYEGLGPEVIEFKQGTVEFSRDFPIGTYYLAVVYAQDDPDDDGTAAGEIAAVVKIYENSQVLQTYSNITLDTAINGTISHIDQESQDLSTLEPSEALFSVATMVVPADGAITFTDPVAQSELKADIPF